MTDDGKPTNEGNDTGAGNNSNVPDDDSKADGSLLSKATSAAERLEKANKIMSDNLDRQEKMVAENLLAGTSGGHVEAKMVSKEDTKVNNGKEFFKDTALGDAIGKANE